MEKTINTGRDSESQPDSVYKYFDKIPIPINELKEFLRIDESKIPRERPYVYYMFVMTADGIGSLLEKDYPDTGIGVSGPGVALKHFRDKVPEARGAYMDWDLLQFGWADSDAVIAGPTGLRANTGNTWMPDKRFLDYRNDAGKGEPLRVVVTGSGFDARVMKGPVFHPSGFRTLVATSEKGRERMLKEFGSGYDKSKLRFESFGEERVAFPELLKFLRKEMSVKILDLQGGPNVAGQFFESGLVDEYRITISPAIAGYINSLGANRPGPAKASFKPDDLVLMKLIRLGVHGSHIFERFEVIRK